MSATAGNTLASLIEKWADGRKRMDRYRSVLDFLFCETFELFRGPCFDYYKGNGPQLKAIITTQQRELYTRTMLLVLQVAYDAYAADRRVTWGWTREEALRLMEKT